MPKKMKVLVVDDRRVNRRLLRRILESKGHEVQEAADGQEGLDMLRLHKTDLIISDALMPGMDGFSFLRKIYEDAELKTIPFIFYSAVYIGSNDEKLARSLGARAFIEKPASPDEFLEKLQVILKQIEADDHPAPVKLIKDEEEYLRKHSDVIATKLEEKVAELEAQHLHMEDRVRERTAELQTLVNAMAGREVRMAGLKLQVKSLQDQLEEAGLQPISTQASTEKK